MSIGIILLLLASNLYFLAAIHELRSKISTLRGEVTEYNTQEHADMMARIENIRDSYRDIKAYVANTTEELRTMSSTTEKRVLKG